MYNKNMYIEKLHKVLSPIGFYVWKPLNNDDIEEQVDYIHYRLLFNELTKEQNDLIIAAGNLKFVYSIDMNVDIRGKKYLFIRTTDLKNLLALKDIYTDKQLEINIHLNYIINKIEKYL
jgi:hypothetical protein